MEPQEIIKVHKKKAMTSEKASIVKKDGHINETYFADLIGGQVIPGQRKPDVSKNGFKFSLKKNCKRIQWALYSRNSKNWSESSPSSLICKNILTLYPKTFEEYQENKNHFKNILRERMIAFKDHLSQINNLKEYLSFIFTMSGEVDFIVMRDGIKQYIFDANEVIDVIVDTAKIDNSKARKPGDTPEQKVLVTIPKNNKYINLLELEIRNSSKGHYAEFLCVCNRNQLFEHLKGIIVEEAVYNDILVVRGKAIHDFQQKIGI
jgi:hypothetical protein